MGKLTSVKPHLSAYEISGRLKASSGRQRRRLLVIWDALVDPREARHITLHTGRQFPWRIIWFPPVMPRIKDV